MPRPCSIPAEAASRLFVRAKSTGDKAAATLEILAEILAFATLDNKERLSRIVSEARARTEQRLVPAGHMVVATRLRARSHAANAMDEAMSGLTNLLFLRDLEKRIQDDFRSVAKDMERIRSLLLAKNHLILNATMDADMLSAVESDLASLVNGLPVADSTPVERTVPAFPAREGLAIPAQVNYVGKGCDVDRARLRLFRRGPGREQAHPHRLSLGKGARAGRCLRRVLPP